MKTTMFKVHDSKFTWDLMNTIAKFQSWLDFNYGREYEGRAGTIYFHTVEEDSFQVDTDRCRYPFGYHDHNRTIKINKNATSQHQEIFKKFLTQTLKQNNMWFYDKSEGFNWFFHYGHDSGD